MRPSRIVRLVVFVAVSAWWIGAARADAPAGPIEVFTIATNSLAESRLLYEQGLGLTLRGPIEVDEPTRAAQRRLWGIPQDIDWQTYVLERSGTAGAAKIRLLLLDRAMPAYRRDWRPTGLGPYTIGFPNQRQEQLDGELRRLGFGALNALERSTFRNDAGREYEIIETVHTAPDFIGVVGVARGPGEPPIAPVDAHGMGGPAYSAMIVRSVDPMVEFMQGAFGYTVKTRRVWKSTGMSGALALPDGTEFDFAQLVPPDADYGFVIFMSYSNVAMTESALPPRLPARGLVMYTLRVADLEATLKHARSLGASDVRGPVELSDAATGRHRHATLVAPNGVMFELVER
jgi:catechol 2,3-dioxygenase-like lactoylglutathione lyase family enzyme